MHGQKTNVLAQMLIGDNMTCSLKLRAEGKPYPRTCSKCKLGPCSDGYSATEIISKDKCFLVTGITGEKIVTFSESRAQKLVILSDGFWEEVGFEV